jgi:hypothetical protein
VAYISPVLGIFDSTINSSYKLAITNVDDATASPDVQRECIARINSLFSCCFALVCCVVFIVPEWVALNVHLLSGRSLFSETTWKANFLFFRVIVLGVAILTLGTLSPPVIYNWCNGYQVFKRDLASLLTLLPQNFNEIAERLQLNLNQFSGIAQNLGNWRNDLATYLAESEIIECRHMLSRHMSFSSMDYTIFKAATRRLLLRSYNENLVNEALPEDNLQTGTTDWAAAVLFCDRLFAYYYAARRLVASPDQTFCFYNVVYLAFQEAFSALLQEGFSREDLIAYTGEELEALHGRMILSLVNHSHITSRRIEIRFPEQRVTFDSSHNLLNLYEIFCNLKDDRDHLSPQEEALLIRALNHRNGDDGSLLHGRARRMFQRISALIHQNVIDQQVLIPMTHAYGGQFDYTRRILTEAERLPVPRGPLIE